MKAIWRVLGAVAATQLVACVGTETGESLDATEPAGVMAADADIGADGEEPLGEVQQAVVYPHAVGVIVNSSSDCADNNWTHETFYLDMEDVDDSWGWGNAFTNWEAGFHSDWFTRDHAWSPGVDTGTELRGSGVRLRFCRVNGDDMPKRERPYALLSLATDCPVAATKVSLYIDTEDDSNSNSWSAGLAPNVVNKYGASLQFCVFGTTTSPQSFPTLGMSYSVFHDFDDLNPGTWVKSKKYVFFDDEDDTPSTRFTPSTGTAVDNLKRILNPWVLSDGDTGLFLEIAKVK